MDRLLVAPRDKLVRSALSSLPMNVKRAGMEKRRKAFPQLFPAAVLVIPQGPLFGALHPPGPPPPKSRARHVCPTPVDNTFWAWVKRNPTQNSHAGQLGLPLGTNTPDRHSGTPGATGGYRTLTSQHTYYVDPL